MISCIIVDDEQHAVDLLVSHISKTQLLDLQFSTTSSVEAFQYLQQHQPQLIFLDIQMPELDGIQLIRLAGKRSKIILTTAYSEYALEGYEHDIIDYLLKPILFDRFLKAVQKTVAILSKPFADPSLEIPLGADDFIFVRTETRNKIVRVILRDIEYIEGMGNYVSIFTAAARIITLSTIRELEEKLPQGFIRIHHSYLVPIQKITAAEGNQVQISKHTLPIGDVYKKAFLAAIEKRVINKK